MKKLLFLSLILFPIILYAQFYDDGSNIENSNGFHMDGAIGTVTFDNVTYSEIHLMPELGLGKFGIGFDFDFLIDENMKIRKEDWDETKDIITKIYMIKYGQRKDPFYARVGGFPNYTLAHGLIMYQYSNMLRYPQVRQIGGMIGINTAISGLGIEAFSSNVARNEVLAARAHMKPLNLSKIILLKNLDVGLSVVTDRNEYGGLNDVTFDTDVDGIPDNIDVDADNDGSLDASHYVLHKYPILNQIISELDHSYPNFDELIQTKKESVDEYSFDYELPLVQGEKFYLSHYGEAAKIQDYNMGFIFPGFYSKFLIFQASIDFRHFQDKFIPGYFDQLYDQQRATTLFQIVSPDSELYAIHTKKELIKYATAADGWFASLTSNIAGFVTLTVSYQDMFGESNSGKKSLWGNLRINPKIVPRIKEADITYSQVNVDNLTEIRSNNAFLEGKLAYELSGNTNLVGRYSERYIDMDGDGKIIHRNEILKTFSTAVEFRF